MPPWNWLKLPYREANPSCSQVVLIITHPLFNECPCALYKLYSQHMIATTTYASLQPKNTWLWQKLPRSHNAFTQSSDPILNVVIETSTGLIPGNPWLFLSWFLSACDVIWHHTDHERGTSCHQESSHHALYGISVRYPELCSEYRVGKWDQGITWRHFTQ